MAADDGVVKEVTAMITMTGSGIALLVVALGALAAMALREGSHQD
jgi:hypothetical protein